MGRPSRKRPRPPPLTEAESSALQSAQKAAAGAVVEGACSTYSNSLRSLVNSSSNSSSSGTGGASKDAVGEAIRTVQHVWGELSEAEISAASSALSLGGTVEIDRAGVAWLVNTPTRSEQRQRHGERLWTASALGNQGQDVLPSPPQQPMPDGHASASAAATSAAGAEEDTARRSEHDDATSSPPSGAPFCACDASLRGQLSRAKEEFDDIPPVVFKRVRSACNPAEALGSGSFLNRSAMKLANIDAVLEGLLALVPGRSRNEDDEKPVTSTREEGEATRPLQFVDLCGGPGGFSEYILRRRRQLDSPARGWGISLREDKGRRVSDIGVKGSTGDRSCSRGTVRDAALMDDNGGDVGGGVCARNSPVLAGEESESTTLRGGTDSMGAPVPSAGSAAGLSRGIVADEGRRAHHGGRDDVDSTNTERDPCAWRLAHLRPWCDLTVSTAGTESAPAATEFLDKGDAANRTASGAIDAVDNGTAADAPSFEMRIDYGPKGTGDLTDEANLRGFVDTVLASTAGRRRTDLVVADGGFGAARDALAQESLISPLVHCEALAALLLLREGGVFVCKLFECWTEPTAALVYLLHRKFRRIAIVKPITSRPASGERYLLCIGLLPTPPSTAGCQYTNALRARVLALLATRAHRQNCGAGSALATVSTGSGVGQATCSLSQEGGGRAGEDHGGTGDGGVSGIDGDAAADGRLNGALEVEAQMKQDESFMSYLRLSNNTLASLQANACARIVDVASTKRGRTWAFRDSNSSREVRGENSLARRGELLSCIGGTEEIGDDAAAVQCFFRAWGLVGI